MASNMSSGSNWDTENTGAPPINASNLPVDDAGEGKKSGEEEKEPNDDSSPSSTDGNEQQQRSKTERERVHRSLHLQVRKKGGDWRDLAPLN